MFGDVVSGLQAARKGGTAHEPPSAELFAVNKRFQRLLAGRVGEWLTYVVLSVNGEWAKSVRRLLITRLWLTTATHQDAAAVTVKS